MSPAVKRTSVTSAFRAARPPTESAGLATSWPSPASTWERRCCCSRVKPTGCRIAGHCSIKAITQNKYIYLSLSLPFQFIDQITSIQEAVSSDPLPTPPPCRPWSFTWTWDGPEPRQCSPAAPAITPLVWPLSAGSTVQSALESRQKLLSFYLHQFYVMKSRRTIPGSS